MQEREGGGGGGAAAARDRCKPPRPDRHPSDRVVQQSTGRADSDYVVDLPRGASRSRTAWQGHVPRGEVTYRVARSRTAWHATLLPGASESTGATARLPGDVPGRRRSRGSASLSSTLKWGQSLEVNRLRLAGLSVESSGGPLFVSVSTRLSRSA